MTKSDDIRARVTQLVAGAPEEVLRRCLPFFLNLFPATPKITSPEPDGPIFDFAGLGWVVACRTNRIDIDYQLTVLDLSDPANVINPQDITPTDYLFFALIPANALISGNQYRIRMDVKPGTLGNGHEYDTVYTEFW